MKKLVLSLGVGAMLALPVVSVPAIAAQPVTEIKGQPHMKAALAALQTAKAELKKAKHNKGGHRVAAIKLVKQAIKEINEGAQHAKDKKKEKKNKQKIKMKKNKLKK